jgi:hypothetical protein
MGSPDRDGSPDGSLDGSPHLDGSLHGEVPVAPASSPARPDGVPSAGVSPASSTSRLTGSDALKLHLTLAGGLVLCAAAFWFEVRRALGGNELSWAYVFEWPLFAAFALYLWWQTLHQNRRRQQAALAPKMVAPEHVEMLRRWQAHVRDMADAEAEADVERGDPGTTPR